MTDSIQQRLMKFAEWREEVDQRLLAFFAITIEDSGVDENFLMSHWRSEQSATDFTEWFGFKYDLTRRSEVC